MTSAAGSRWQFVLRAALAAAVWWTAIAVLVVTISGASDHTSVAMAADFAHRRYGFDPAWVVPVAVLAIGLTGAAAIALVGGMAALLDPAHVSRDAVFWGLRAPGFRGWAAMGAMAIALIVAYETEFFYFFLAIGAAMLAALLCVPFVASHEAGMRGDPGEWRPRWSWPGWTVLRLSIAVLLVGELVDAGTDAGWLAARGHAVGTALVVVAEVATILLGTWISAFVAGLWIERPPGNDARAAHLAGRAARPATLRAFLALAAWSGYLAAFLFPPVIAATWLAIYDLPQLSVEFNDGRPLVGSGLIEAIRDWWLVALAMMMPAWWLAHLRLWITTRDSPQR